MKVLYYSPTIWANTDFYRTTGVLPFINHPEIILRDISNFGTVNQWDLKSSDVIIVQRPSTPKSLSLIDLAKTCGLKVISDFDDDILNVDFLNPTFIQYQHQKDIILQCIDKSDEVWCSTASINESIGRGITIPNSLNDFLFDNRTDFNSYSNKIVWRGSAAHEADMYEKAAEIVEMVNGSPEFDFYFIGHRFTYFEQRCGNNYNSVESMPITQYFAYLKQLKPIVMIFPLCNTKLNQGKSNISWIEASWAGSAYFGNTMLPEFNKKGTLPIEQFESIIHNLDTMESAHKASVLEIKENLLLSNVNELRINSLLNI